MDEVTYDDIIVGGGVAGCVLAARLSEEPGRRVLLLEAGPDGEHTERLLDGSTPVTDAFVWPTEAIARGAAATPSASVIPAAERVSRVFAVAARHLADKSARHLAENAPRPDLQAAEGTAEMRFPYPLGKVLGGGSSINGGLAFHARREDYARWVELGNAAWSWEAVRPAMARIAGEEDGKPALPAEKAGVENFTPIQRAFFESCREIGYPPADIHRGDAPGLDGITKSFRGGQRFSAAAMYLAGARGRSNLTIQPDCLVDRLLFAEGGGGLEVVGVKALLGGQHRRFSGSRVILTAGAIHSPAILLRSGVGAGDDITRLGGTPRLDLPGVGRHLVEHPAVSIWAAPREGACREGEPVHQAMMQAASSLSEGFCDLQFYMLSSVPTRILPPLREVVGADLTFGISAVVATPHSTGRIELTNLDPTGSPRIDLGLLEDGRDLERMKEGVRLAWRILESEHLASRAERIALWRRDILDSDARLEKMIKSTVRGGWHPVGTLRMGAAEDPQAVVDAFGHLHGCLGVVVADGSVMPSIPSVPTHLTCLVIAERIAAQLRRQNASARQ